MKTNSSAPFHKVDMSRYLSDPNYESAMIPFCKFAMEYSEYLLIAYANRLTPISDHTDCMLDDMENLVSIENYLNMYLTRNISGYAQFYLPKWFLVELVKEEVSKGARDLISFTISLIRECK